MALPLAVDTDMLEVEHADRVLTIRLNRPDALNAFRPEMLAGIEALVIAAGGRDDVSVIVLEGAGRAFSAGVDLKVLQGIDPKGGKIGDVFDQPARGAYRAIRRSELPVIAKVHGACFTGALEIALHCDFVFTTRDTKFGDTHARFGLRPTWGMSQTLAQAVGVRRAKELSYTARTFLGAEAVELGVANAAVENEEALDALVAERAARIAANSRAAVAAMKKLYDLAQEGRDLEGALEAELATEFPEIEDTSERLAGF
ncbi:MAG: enoyl-CoA hydratase/isomerase family protein [bacterium]|nr:enoyl-CoA hydratase/isomerase family protein [bacterium]